MALFQWGSFRSTGGLQLSWKIECDSLTIADWINLANLIAASVSFGSVEGVPRGGIKLADLLTSKATRGPLLIVDDVLTTGGRMERQRAGRDAIGVVVFARGPCPTWITPIMEVHEAFRNPGP